MIGLNTIWTYHDTWFFGMQNTSVYLKKLSRCGDMFDLTYNLLGTTKTWKYMLHVLPWLSSYSEKHEKNTKQPKMNIANLTIFIRFNF